MEPPQEAAQVEEGRYILTEEAKKARNEYLRRWRAANPDKLKAARQRYWEKRAARAAEAERGAATEEPREAAAK